MATQAKATASKDVEKNETGQSTGKTWVANGMCSMCDRVPDREPSFSHADAYDQQVINVILPIFIFGGAVLLGLEFLRP